MSKSTVIWVGDWKDEQVGDGHTTGRRVGTALDCEYVQFRRYVPADALEIAQARIAELEERLARLPPHLREALKCLVAHPGAPP